MWYIQWTEGSQRQAGPTCAGVVREIWNIEDIFEVGHER